MTQEKNETFKVVNLNEDEMKEVKKLSDKHAAVKKLLLIYEALNDNNSDWTKLPPYSPDINIIELVWAELKRFLRKKLLKNNQEIANRVKLFFDTELTVEKCRNYISRVQEVM